MSRDTAQIFCKIYFPKKDLLHLLLVLLDTSDESDICNIAGDDSELTSITGEAISMDESKDVLIATSTDE